jgi:hypothetical protein
MIHRYSEKLKGIEKMVVQRVCHPSSQHAPKITSNYITLSLNVKDSFERAIKGIFLFNFYAARYHANRGK